MGSRPRPNDFATSANLKPFTALIRKYSLTTLLCILLAPNPGWELPVFLIAVAVAAIDKPILGRKVLENANENSLAVLFGLIRAN
jgi:hypothetical protein